MRILRLWHSRMKGTLSQCTEDEQLDEEVSAHLDMLTEHYVKRGVQREEAARRARLQFGNVASLREKQRARRGFLGPAELWRDLRFAARMLKKEWPSNVAVVLALALGIGMNGAVFTFVNALLLRPPAGVDALGKVAEVWLHSRNGTGIQSYLPFNSPDYFFYRDHTRSFDGLLAFDGDGSEAIWNRSGTGQTIKGQLVSGNYFAVLGVNAALGRALSADDDQVNSPRRAILLSHSFWTTQLGADPGVVGKSIVLNGVTFDIAGVAPAGFAGLLIATEPDFWAPISSQGVFTHDNARMNDRNSSWLIVAGRLKHGVGRKQAQAELEVIERQIDQLHPEAYDHTDPVVYPATLVPGPYRGYVGAFTGLLLAVFALVLLIACTNAASLMLARATGRAREMAIRAALGATRVRLIVQSLVESLMLSAIAGGAALWIAWMAAGLLMQLKPASVPITLALPFDWRVVLFTVLVSVATGVLFGLAPGLRCSAVNPAPVLKEETQSAGFRKSRLRIVLLVGEIAVSVILLTGATLCVRSLLHATAIDPGFDTQHIAMATLNPESLGYSPEKVNAFYSQLIERVRRSPSVTSASYVDALPLGTSRSETSVGRRVGDDQIGVRSFRVSSGFFATMGIPLLGGRDFTADETRRESPDAVVVNEYLARRLWPGQNPIGQHIALSGEKSLGEVIGVVKDGKYRSLGEMPVAAVYRGLLPPQRTIVIRTPGDDRPLLEMLEREVRMVDPMMVATNVQSIEKYMALPLFPARTTGLLLGASGILALVLTAIGLFGVIAYVVSQRTHEIGVRIAMGARRGDVLKLVLRQGLSITLVGLGIGTCGAIAASRLLSPLLYGVSANDPTVLAEVSLGLAAVAALACYLPARRAMRIDPAEALRYE
jgi:predicted permease